MGRAYEPRRSTPPFAHFKPVLRALSPQKTGFS
jgi:hypothetical protein